jgi:general secretion pathway protein D
LKTAKVVLLLSILLNLLFPPVLYSQEALPEEPSAREKKITLDFNNVDLPILVKFFSELTGKNFVIDEKVRGKVTVFSPTKMTIPKAYEVFLSVLDLKGFTTVQSGDVVQILPTTEVPPERTVRVYALSNASAEELARTLTGFLARPAVAAQHPRIRVEGDFEGQVLVFPDKPSNSLIITASAKDFELMREIIQKFDQIKKQVYVEAVIMEVSVTKLRSLGVELANLNPDSRLGVIGGTNFGAIGNFAVNGPQALSDSSGLIVGAGTGVISSPFSAGGSILNIKGLLRALQSDSEVNILSTPQILATNYQKARIVVGQNVPFPTSSSTTVGGVIQRNVDRKDVGVSLEITPEVLEDKRVKLDIRQEISSLVDTPQGVLLDLGPTTNKREAATSVIVTDQQTIVIGGLIRDDYIKTENKVPFLGDIPFLGWLFKYQTKMLDKTNLMIFLTPHILREPVQFTAMEEEKVRQIDEFIEKNKFDSSEKPREDFLKRNADSPRPQ